MVGEIVLVVVAIAAIAAAFFGGAKLISRQTRAQSGDVTGEIDFGGDGPELPSAPNVDPYRGGPG